MSKAPTTPRTLREAIIYFADPDRCLDYVASRRWPNGVTCPTCGSDKVHFLAKQRRWKCATNHPKRQFSAKVGTIFEDSPIGFEKWLPAMWLLANCKNGISSYELARAIKVTQRSAWFMLQRIRLAMQTSGGKLGGGGEPVEVDESWIGGSARWMNKKQKAKTKTQHKAGARAYDGKAIVLGMLERGGRVRMKVVPDVSKESLVPHIKANVEFGSAVYTDNWQSYLPLSNTVTLVSPDAREVPEDRLGERMYEHASVNHAAEEYVRGNVHTNGIENFWALLKRTIRGTYVSVEPFHLFRYLDEQSFRFNERKGTDADRFAMTLDATAGRRLTYDTLTAQGGLA